LLDAAGRSVSKSALHVFCTEVVDGKFNKVVGTSLIFANWARRLGSILEEFIRIEHVELEFVVVKTNLRFVRAVYVSFVVSIWLAVSGVAFGANALRDCTAMAYDAVIVKNVVAFKDREGGHNALSNCHSLPVFVDVLANLNFFIAN